MLVRPKRAFPGTALLLRGTAIAHIWPWLLVLGVEAAAVTWAYQWWQVEEPVSLTLIPFSLVGLALSIFLGFRNNACYDRWWEARKLWGLLINTSRALARQTAAFVGPPPREAVYSRSELADLHVELVYRIIAFAYALKAHLRTEARFDRLAAFLPADEVEALKTEPNVPNAVLAGLSQRYHQAWRRGWISDFHLATLETTLMKLSDIQGGCERIKNTPVPLSYTVLTHRIVGVYCAALPFGIVTEVGWLTPAVVLIIAFAFLGLDAVGTQIEDPFETDPNDLPLTALSRIIERDLRARLGESELPPPIQPDRGVLL